MNPILQYIDTCYPIHNNTPKGKTLLAEDAGVSWGTIHKASLGLYSSIPVKLVNYMAANPCVDASGYETPSSAVRWNELYWDFIKAEMTKLGEEIYSSEKRHVLFIRPQDLHKHFPSFAAWRSHFSKSQMGFCKQFLIHQAILNKYEDGQMKNLPQSIKERLRFLGVSDQYLTALGALPVSNRAVSNKAVGRK